MSEPCPMPDSWPVGSEVTLATRERSIADLSAYSREELARYLAGARDAVEAELVEADRPTRPAPLVPIELVRVPRHDGHGHEWLDALRIVDAELPLRAADSSAPPPVPKREAHDTVRRRRARARAGRA